MKCHFVNLPMLFAAILLSQAISIAPSFAQPASPTPTPIPVNVPQVPYGAQTYNGNMQITNLTVTLSFPVTTPVKLTFISPDSFASSSDSSWQVTLNPGMPPDSTCRVDTNAVKCHDFPVPSNLTTSCFTCMDNITIVPGSSADGSMQFVVKFALLSDYNVGGSGTGRCASTQSQNPKTYQIVPDQAVTSVCVDSYSKHLNQCTSNVNLIPLSSADGAWADGAFCSK